MQWMPWSLSWIKNFQSWAYVTKLYTSSFVGNLSPCLKSVSFLWTRPWGKPPSFALNSCVLSKALVCVGNKGGRLQTRLPVLHKNPKIIIQYLLFWLFIPQVWFQNKLKYIIFMWLTAGVESIYVKKTVIKQILDQCDSLLFWQDELHVTLTHSADGSSGLIYYKPVS